MSHTIHATAHRLVATLRHHVHHNSPSSTTTTINALDWTFAATLTAIGLVGLGHDFQLGDNDADAVAIHAAWRHLARYATTFTAFVAPLVVRAFPFTLLAHRVQARGGEAEAIVHARALKVLAEKSQNARGCDGEEKEEETSGPDFLSTLLQTRPQDPGAGYSSKDILEHVRLEKCPRSSGDVDGTDPFFPHFLTFSRRSQV